MLTPIISPGLIFLTICLPALLGGPSGALADIYGPKIISLIGFTITIPSLAALSVVTYDALFMEVLLCVLLTLAGVYLLPFIGMADQTCQVLGFPLS